MRISRRVKTIVIVFGVMYALSWILPSCSADANTYQHIFHFYVKRADDWEPHQLYLFIPDSLYDYYYGKNHATTDLVAFITPGVFYPFAKELWKICYDTPQADESFVNTVLMIVHQLSYRPSSANYPIETLVENSGDCDTLSYLAASMLIAGGFDVVLLSYENYKHMNVGVKLSQPPILMSTRATYYEYCGQRYYEAECTSRTANILSDWRIGESPEKYDERTVQVLPIDAYQYLAPGTISANLDGSLTSSSITLDLDPTILKIQEPVRITGTISSVESSKHIVIYTSTTGYEWNALTTLTADSNGAYFFEWTPLLHGICYVRASYLGGQHVAAADSTILTLRIASDLNMNAILVIGYSLIAVLMMLTGLIISEVIQTARVFL